jgi:type II secretory ATPase GspE/PulE/Tfp pilus assembly ATPase PilB-like protein
MEANGVLKLREDEDSVTVGLTDGGGRTETDTAALLERLKRFHRKPCLLVRVDSRELQAYLGRTLSGGGNEGGAPGTGQGTEQLALDRLANDAPIVNLVNSLLIEAIRQDASDIHIESFADRILVRYRIDGALRIVSSITTDQFAGVSSRIKIMANLNIMERRLPQDGRISVHLEGKPFDLRVSVVPVAHGESIVLRLFQRTGNIMSLDELGFDEEQVGAVRQSVALPHGLFLVTGPTGSGKTTTLTAILAELRSEERKIITIEDPVEYLIDGVNQIPTNDQIGLTFDSLLRRVLRQNPNIIMVGEIRDAATAELAVRAALTGHLVLSTLHTNDAVSAVTRLANMGIERYLISGVLRAVLAQRLVRRVCDRCAEKAPPAPAQRARLESFGVEPERLVAGTGCDRCGGTGFHGRIAIGEIFRVDRELEQAIANERDTAKMTDLLAGRGMRSLLADGYRKAARGLTTLSEVEAVA